MPQVLLDDATVEMASLGGAKDSNQAEQLGSLEVGKQADLVLCDLASLQPYCLALIGVLVLGRPAQTSTVSG